MDQVNRLRHFRAVVDAGSFTRAADMLGSSKPVVSRAIAQLEQRIGSRLFHRSTRHLSLTEAAERLYERACRVIDDLDALEAEVLSDTRKIGGTLRVVAHTTATVHRLVPLIASFKRENPAVTLEISLVERPIDLVADGYDLGLVIPSMLTSESTVTRLLESIPLVVVAAPSYLAAQAAIRTPTDLARHTLVSASIAMRRPVLRFRVDGEVAAIPVHGDISSNSAMFNRQMVLQGFGLGVLPLAMVEEDLASGTLAEVLEGFPLVDDTIEIRIAYSSRALMPSKVRAFIEHASRFYEALAPGRPAG